MEERWETAGSMPSQPLPGDRRPETNGCGKRTGSRERRERSVKTKLRKKALFGNRSTNQSGLLPGESSARGSRRGKRAVLAERKGEKATRKIRDRSAGKEQRLF